MRRFFVFFLVVASCLSVISCGLSDPDPLIVAQLPIPTTTTTTSTTTTTTTTTTILVTKIPSTEIKRCPSFEPIFEQYGLVPVKTFSYIAWRESRCRIKAINALWDEDGNMTYHLNKNKTWDSGLLQVNSSHKTITRKVCGGGVELLMNLDCNLRVAKYLLDNGGLAHWGMSEN